MKKRTVICPKCDTPIGKYPEVMFEEVKIMCRGCTTNLTIRANYVLGNKKVPDTVSYDQNKDFVDDTAVFDPTNDLNEEIDRELLLKQLSPRDRKIIRMIENGYTYTEIGDEFGCSRQAIHRGVVKIRKQIKKNTH